MAVITTYKVRSGNPLPTSQGGNVIVFCFGTEAQDIENNSCETQVLKSSDMCMYPDGQYFSANYKAYEGKVNGELLFSANLTKKPVISNNYNNSGGKQGNSA